MKKRTIKIVICLTIFLFIGFILYNIIAFLYWINNTEVKMIGKTHFDFYVEAGRVIDYEDFLNPDEEIKALTLIDKIDREKISNYMKDNNLKLQEGHHYFNRVDGTYEEYIREDFRFTKCK